MKISQHDLKFVRSYSSVCTVRLRRVRVVKKVLKHPERYILSVYLWPFLLRQYCPGVDAVKPCWITVNNYPVQYHSTTQVVIPKEMMSHNHVIHDQVMGRMKSSPQVIVSHDSAHNCQDVTAVTRAMFTPRPDQRFHVMDYEAVMPGPQVDPALLAEVQRSLKEALKHCGIPMRYLYPNWEGITTGRLSSDKPNVVNQPHPDSPEWNRLSFTDEVAAEHEKIFGSL